MRLLQVWFSMGRFLHEAGIAQARWEYDVGRTILRRRWKVLLVMLLPTLVAGGLGFAFAEDSASDLLGGSKAYMPNFLTPKMFYGSIMIGLMAGLITGCIGAGGGYVLTPALMSLGIRGITSVGTDQFHLFAKAIIGTAIHRKLGNVNVRLAVWFMIGSLGGVTVGGITNRACYQKSPALSDAFISGLYVFILGILGFYALCDWIRLRNARAGAALATEATTSFAKKLQAVRLTPRVKFDEDIVPGGRSVSVYPIIICGFIVGVVCAIMGVGGGFLTFPMFVYGIGVSTFTTVGTSILQVAFTTFYSSVFQYAIYGFVFYTIAMGTLLGSLVGVQIGALVTKMVTGAVIRAFYAVTILAGFANRCCALPKKLGDAGYLSLAEPVGRSIEGVGTFVFFALIGVFSIWVLAVFFRNVGKVRAGEIGGAANVEH